MNDLKKNVELFVNILGMARTSAVQKWDNEALTRAFRWAHYFEQVHKKTRSNPVAVENVTQNLLIACTTLDTKLGLSLLTYPDLKKSTHILRKSLLDNPCLSKEFYLELVGQLKATEAEEMKKRLGSLSNLKATLQILQLMIQKRFESLSESKGDTNNRVVDGGQRTLNTKEPAYCELTANAELLKKYLKTVIHTGLSGGSHLYKKLFGMVNQKQGIDILMTTLLLKDKDEKVSKYILEFIHDVMVVTWKGDWKEFLQMPLNHLFSICAKEYPEFMVEYLSVLEHCACSLQNDLDTKNFNLDMEKNDCPPSEQMAKYYYFLIQTSLQTVAQTSLENEINVDSFIKKYCKNLSPASNSINNVWKKISDDLRIGSDDKS